MNKYTVNIPVWHIHSVNARTKEEAMEKAQMQNAPSEILGIEDMCIEVNEETN